MLIQRCAEPVASTLDRRCQPVAADGPPASKGLETPDVAAAADDRVVPDDLDVPDVAGRSLRAAVETARASRMLLTP